MVCILEWILHNKQYSRQVKTSVVVVVIGVGVCTVTDVKVNAKGFICACVAVLSTSFQQIVSKLPSVLLQTDITIPFSLNANQHSLLPKIATE